MYDMAAAVRVSQKVRFDKRVSDHWSLFDVRVSTLVAVAFSVLLLPAYTNGLLESNGAELRCPNSFSILPCTCSQVESSSSVNLVCRDGSLAAFALPLKAWPRNITIDSLTITNSSISKLFGPIFANLSLSKLYITYSKVSVITEDVFAPLISSLNELSLEGNELVSLPTLAIDQLANLSLLSLERNRLDALPASAFAKLTALSQLNLGWNRIKSLKAATLLGSTALERLSIHGNQLSKLERGTFKSQKKLKYLDLSANKFTSMDKADFNELSGLLNLNISWNQIAKLPQSIFSRNSQLLSLNLSNNKLVEIDAYMLRGVRFIREFFAEGNEIASVARRAFGSSTRLRKLDLSHNRLEEVSTEMFNNLQWLDILDLAFNRITKVAKGAFQKMYKVAIDLSYNELQHIESNSFIEVANITTLDLSHNNLTSFPADTFEASDVTILLLNHNLFSNASLIPISNLTSIKQLNVSYNQLQEVNRKSFTSKKHYEMEIVDLSHNQIRDMSGSVFEKFWALRYLNLSNNVMTKLGHGAFGSLPTLLELDITENNLTDINSGAIANLISLKTLYAQRNSIKKMFKVPVALNELHLEQNAISELTVGSFPMINSLLELYLDSNHLSQVESDVFRNMLTLRILSLANNNFTNVSELGKALQKLTSLQYLNLSGNRINGIESRAFGNLPNLFQVKLDKNEITEISPFAFEGLLQLINLTLSRNQIAAVTSEAFKGLVSLQLLDMSHNRLTRLENKTNSFLEDLLSLESLSLSYNRLSFITHKTFPSSPWIPYKLASVDISHNILQSVQTAVGLESVRNLSLAFNNIREVKPHVLANMSRLEYLDVSNNRLTRLTEGVFQASDKSVPLQSLTAVKLANNRIEWLPVHELMALKSLLQLDVSSNKLATLNATFAALTKRNVDINVTGNPFLCNCDSRQKIDRVRIYRQARQEVKEFPDEWDSLTCSQPDNLNGRVITELTGDELHCSQREQESILEGELAFRGTQWSPMRRDSLRVVWLVRNRQLDVSAFKITIAQGDSLEFCSSSTSPPCLSTVEVPYNMREHIFDGLNSRQHYRLCISWLDSSANEGPHYYSQCISAKPRNL